jgi:hypothetical protein
VKAADAILVAWRAGVRNKIRLVNVGIMTFQQARATEPTESAWSFFPRVFFIGNHRSAAMDNANQNFQRKVNDNAERRKKSPLG